MCSRNIQPKPRAYFGRGQQEQDRIAGEAGFYANEGGGSFTLLKAYPNLGKDWDIIVPGRFSEGVHALFSDLFFYDRKNGTARFYRTDGNGNIDLLKQHTGLQDWDIIVPGDWGGESTWNEGERG
jgi:hypothetical protein